MTSVRPNSAANSAPFQGRLAVLTGAGSGIGRALCLALAQRGTRLAISDLDPERLAETVKLLETNSAEILDARTLDVRDAEACKAFIEDASKGAVGLDFLFNNAGIAIGGEAQDLSLEDWKAVLAVNLDGVIHGVHTAYPIMVAQGHGHIINIASIAGLTPFPLAISYTTSKHAVVGLSRALRAEAKSLGVRVSAVCPGSIDTRIWTDSPIRGYERQRIADLVKPRWTAERCAAAILRGVARNKGTIIMTGEALLLSYLQRLSPGLAGWLQSRLVDRARKLKAAEPKPTWNSTNHG